MSIPKGLIVYRAPRHQNIYPMNFKRRYYPDTISIQKGSQTKITKIAKITKVTRGFDLSFKVYGVNTGQILHYFSKFHRIKRVLIDLNQIVKPSKKCKNLGIYLMKKAFRTMKDLQQITLNNLGLLRKDLKCLLLQRSLQRLIVSPLLYSEYVNNLAPFMKLCQTAHRRKCWQHLQDLRIDLQYAEHYIGGHFPGSVCNLLKFLQEFKSCESLYKHSHFKLILPFEVDPNESSTEAAALDEILKLKPPFTSICISEGKEITSLLKMAQDAKDLQSLSLQLSDALPENLKTDLLGKFPALQEMRLAVECEGRPYSDSTRVNFSSSCLEKIQSMTHLKSLSLYFYGDPSSVKDKFLKALSKLSELTELHLTFEDMTPFEAENPEELNWPWLKDVFQAIGRMKKLKNLSFLFSTFGFEKSRDLFKSLCQALGNLTNLSYFSLEIEDAKPLKDQDLLTLASSLNKLGKMESLFLLFLKSKFQSRTYLQLMDSIMKNSKILSDLFLHIRCYRVPKEWHQMIYQGIHQMKCLNRLGLDIEGEVEEDVNIELLDAEVQNRMAGGINYLGY